MYVNTYLSVICVPSTHVCCKIIIKKHMLILFYDIVLSCCLMIVLHFESDFLVAFASGQDLSVNNAIDCLCA